MHRLETDQDHTERPTSPSQNTRSTVNIAKAKAGLSCIF